jgi:GNAT superfamily N-acetyltransferase
MSVPRPTAVTVRSFDQVTPDFVALTDEFDRELREREGSLQDIYFGFNRLDGIRDVVVAYDGGQPVGCASFKDRGEFTAEVKRVFVQPGHRGKGVSKLLMSALEARALERGFRTLVLETGRAFTEACGLYRSLGYGEIPNYPPYVGLEHSICFRKEIAP